MSENRSKLSYRKRLTRDLEMCKLLGNMEDVIEIINQKIEDYKAYQRAYYHKKKVDNGKS